MLADRLVDQRGLLKVDDLVALMVERSAATREILTVDVKVEM